MHRLSTKSQACVPEFNNVGIVWLHNEVLFMFTCMREGVMERESITTSSTNINQAVL